MSILITPSAVSSGNSIVATYNRQGKDIGAEPIEEFFAITKTALTANNTTDFIYGNDSDYMIVSAQSNIAAPNVVLSILSNVSTIVFSQTITVPYIQYVGLLVPKGFIVRFAIPTANTTFTLMCKQCSLIERIVL